MASTKAKLYITKERFLPTLPIKNGQIIFIPDSQKVCLDMSSTRYTYQTLREFKTDVERQSMESPHQGFYFVQETNTIWRYTDSWKQITPNNIEPIVYKESEEDFPIQGNKESLYFTDSGIFNWKETTEEYNLIANANRWDVI